MFVALGHKGVKSGSSFNEDFSTVGSPGYSARELEWLHEVLNE
jgi:hypothetical protein